MFVLSGSRLLHVVFLLGAIVPICQAYKYFSEPQGLGLYHYDARYFRGRVSSESRAETLSELIVAFLDIMEAEGIVAWLAHGTLLGWYWNGHTLPWDWDVDMQVDVMTLQTLAEEYNSTVWTAVPKSAVLDTEPRDYILDVNPFWIERVHGDGANFIDARFIDTRNGLYIDITGLTELDPVRRGNIVSCKNYHNYELDDIYPLRETTFEGTKAKVPFNYKTILADEYGQRSMLISSHNGYVWANEISEWIPKEDVRRPYRVNGIPATPATRIIPDEELPYFDTLEPLPDSRPDSGTKGDPHVTAPKSTQRVPGSGSASGASNPPFSIEIKELPADKIDSPRVGTHGNIMSTFWEFLTLFW